MNKNIAILGCGWLGFPLAQSLIEKGYRVYGSTTSEEKLNKLTETGIEPFKISLHENKIEGDINSFLKHCDVLVINIPPRLRARNAENYVSKVRQLITSIQTASIKKIVFISSTSVYPDNNQVITEDTLAEPDTESGRQLLNAENILKNNTNFDTTIIRFSGLIGNDRHPVTFLSGKKDITNPKAPVNLVHLNDCIGIIETIIEKEIWNEVFNVAHPQHPSKESYYTDQADKRGIPRPKFKQGEISTGKIISSKKLIHTLPYNFQTDI